MPHSYMEKYVDNGSKNRGNFNGIFLLFLLLLPSAAQELSDPSDDLQFTCIQGLQKANCICTQIQVNCTDVSLLAMPLGLGANIQSLILRKNLISSMDSIISQLPQSLVYIDVSFNYISSVDWSLLSTLTNLEELHLQMNLIYSLDLSFFYGTKLRVLNVSGNQLVHISLGDLTLPLEELYIEHSGLNYFGFNSSDVLCELKILHVGGNSFSSFPASALSSMTNLEEIKLNNLGLTSLSKDTFSHNTQVQFIDLSDNLLTTLPATIFDGLDKLQNLNLAGNPWSCDCSLIWLKVFIESFLASGRTVINMNVTYCSTETSANTLTELYTYSFSGCEDVPMSRRDKRALVSVISPFNWASLCAVWQTLFLIPCGPSKAASCVYNFPGHAYSFVQFSGVISGLLSKTTCRDMCQENNNSYFVHNSITTSCLCGDIANISGCTECSASMVNSSSFCSNRYSNIGGAVSVVYDLTIIITPTLPQVMMSVNFTLSGGGSIYDTFFWSFGDSTTRSVLNDKTASHTYIYPGQFEVKVNLTSSTSQKVLSAQVVIQLTVVATSDAGELICPPTTVTTSNMLNVSAIFTSACDQKVQFTREYKNRNDQGHVTEYEKECQPLWKKFRGRCIKIFTTASKMVTARLFCTTQGASLLRFYSVEEIDELKSSSLIFQSGAATRYYSGAEWIGSKMSYMWTNTTSKAFVFREILSNATKGNCVAITSAGLQGANCNEVLPFVCEKDPVACIGSQLSNGQMCYDVVTKPATWDQAQAACQTTYTNGNLASIFDSSYNVYISGLLTSRTWIGLRALTAPGYYTWQNGQALSGYTNWANRNRVEPCVSINSSGIWQAEVCDNLNSYLCEYFVGDNVNIPWLVTGFVPIMNDLVPAVTTTVMTAPQILTSSQVTLLLGTWFSTFGQILRWNLQVKSQVADTRLSLQIWRPFCVSGSLVWPGCSNNTSPLFSCANTQALCSLRDVCLDNEYLCVLTNTCLPMAKACTCASVSSISHFDCQNLVIDSNTSKLRLMYLTTIRVPARTTQIHFEPVADINVQAGDIIGFQSENNDIGLCEESSSSEWRHSVLSARTDYWMDVEDIVDPMAYQLKKDLICKINAVITTKKVVLSPMSLNYVTGAGVYNFSLLTNSVISQSCSVTAMDNVKGLLWVYPDARIDTIQGLQLLNVNVKAGVPIVLTVKVLCGSNPTVKWFLNGGSGIVTAFSSDCPTSITSPPDICNFRSSYLESPYSSLSRVFPSGSSLTSIIVNVTNDVSWEALHVNIYAYAPVTLVEFYHDDCVNHTECEVIVETGKTQTFHIEVVKGDMSLVVCYENGQVINNVSSSASALTRIFEKSAVYVLSVNVSNALSWMMANLTVHAQVRANFINITFDKSSDKVAVGVLKTVSAIVRVTAGAQIMVTWSFNEENLQYSLKANTTTLKVSYSYRFNTTGNATVVLLLSNVFGDHLSSSITVEVYKSIDAALALSTSSRYVATSQYFNLTIKVENSSLSDVDNYGMLNFTVDWDNGDFTTWRSLNLLEELQYQYQIAGSLTISVTVFSLYNISNIQTGTVTIEVQDVITGLSLRYDGPKHFNLTITFNATHHSGSNVAYSIDFGDNLTVASFQTSPIFVHRYSVANVYTATVTAKNEVSEKTSTLVLYVYDENLLKIIRINIKYYVTLRKAVDISADVAMEPPDELYYEWDFGNQIMITGQALSRTTASYDNIGIFTITLKVRKYNLSDIYKKEICVEEEVAGLSVSYETPIALKQSGASVLAFFNASVISGSNLVYTWTVNGSSKEIHHLSTLNLTVTEAKVYSVTVKAENNLNSVVQTVELVAIEIITGLRINCQSCFLHAYARTNVSTRLEASVLFGTLMNYTWNFDDSVTSQMGKVVQHNFITPRNYTVTLLAENYVSNESLVMSIVAQDVVTGVSIVASSSFVEVNTSVTFQATFSSGSSVSKQWNCDSSNVIGENSSSLVHTFKSSGHHQCSVVISNAVSSVTKSSLVDVLDQITDLSINQSLKVKQGSANVFAAVDFEYSFTPHINTDFLVSYDWRVQGAASSNASGSDPTLKYTFKSIGIYQIGLKARNAFSVKNVSITVEAQEQISKVYISSNTTSPLQVFTGEVIFFNAVVGTGSQLIYLWTLNGIPQPSKNSSLILPFLAAGNFTVQVAVGNDLDIVTAMAQVSVYIKVSKVAIKIKQNLNLPFVASGMNLDLYSLNVSGTALVYSWTITHVPSGKQWTSDLVNVSFSFNLTGAYQIILNVRNALSSEGDLLTLVVQGTITELKVTLQDSIVATGSSLTFTAEANLDATDVNYIWQIGGEIKEISSFIKLFPVAGVYKVLITAANNVSSMSKENWVRVLDPISNLQIQDCQLVRVAQVAISMQAIVNSGTNVTFTWYVEINNQNTTFTGQTMNINFQTEGNYTVILSAINEISTNTTSCQLQTQLPISHVTVAITDPNPSYIFQNQNVTFKATGNNMWSANFEWRISNYSIFNSTSNTYTISIPIPGNYTLALVASNSVSRVQVFLDFTVKAFLCMLPDVTRVGAFNRSVQRSRPLELEVAIDAKNCTSYLAIHNWTVVKSSDCKGDEDSSHKVDIGDTVTSSPSIVIGPRILNVGFYCVHFMTGYQYTSVSLSIFYAVNVTASELEAIIKGGNNRTVGLGSNLYFDGTLSFDPDNTSKSTLTYKWNCTTLQGVVGYFTYNSNSTFYYNFSNPGNYIITLQVDAPGRATDIAEQIIEVLNVTEFVPTASIMCESCLTLGSIIVSSSMHVVLSADCENCQCEPAFLWKIFEGVKEILPSSSQTTTGLSKKHLVLNKFGVLKDGFNYTFHVQVSCASNTNIFGSASLMLLGNIPPSNGRCTFNPTDNIIPLENQVTVDCSGWVDTDDPENLLIYKILATAPNPMTGQDLEYVLYFGTDETQSVYLSSFTGNSVMLKVMVGDGFGAFAHGGQSEITFNFTIPGSMTITDYIMKQADDHLSALIKQASPISLLQYAIALGQQLNMESQKEVELQTAGKGTQPEQTRAVVRDALTICLTTVVPLSTLEDLQQMALALRLITDYSTEYLTEDSQRLLASTLQVINKILQQKVSKGLDSDDVPLDNLLSVIKNLLNAVNARVYSVESLWQSGRTITIDNFSTDFTDLRPEIAVIVGGMDFTDINLNETHRRFVVSAIVPLLEYLLVLTLQTMNLDEAGIALDIGGIKIKGSRSYVKDIELQYKFETAYISIPPTILSGKKNAMDEVLQVMISHFRNPYTYGYRVPQMANLPVQTISFYETNGTYIQVANLVDNARVGLYMFSPSLANTHTCMNKDTVNGSDVDASMNINYKNVTIAPQKSKVWDVPGTSSQVIYGVGVHVQLRFSILSNNTNITESTTAGVTAYLGINFIPTYKHYSQRLILTPSLMKKGVDHRKFTFFQNTLNPADVLHIVANNNYNQFEVELLVGVYFSSCEYFNTANQIWAQNGCQAQEESTPAITSCQGNHLTSFGGAGIVSITDIHFADLDNLDLLTNPVVFIAVSIIFVIYISAAILCRYLDHLDLKRISKIPLCGQVGSFLYEVTMITGSQYNAGTSAHVGIKLYGGPNKGGARHLTKPGAFQRNCRDTFLIANNTNLGEITKIQIWHDNAGSSPSWFLSHILVKDLQTEAKYAFIVNSWLSLEKDDGAIQKKILVSDEQELKQFYSKFRNVFRGLMSDVHTFISVSNKPDHSRFTRVQRCICCLTCVYLYMFINAMWYGLLKDQTEVNAPLTWNFFGWEEVVIALASTLMVVPFMFGISIVFKRSRCKASMFQQALRPGSAQTIEIDAICNTSADGSSYRCATPLGDWIPVLDRESTTDSINQVPFGLKRTVPMHRNKRKGSSDSTVSGKERPPICSTISQKNFWNKDSIMKSWPDTTPHWPSKGKTQVEHSSAGSSGEGGSGLPKQNSKHIKNTHSSKSMEDSDEDIQQQLDQAEAIVARDDEKRKKKLARKARQASGDGLFDSDDEWVNEELDDVVTKGDASLFNPRKEAELVPNLGRRLSHASFTLPDTTYHKPDSASRSKKDKSSFLQDGARPSIASSSSKSKTIISGRLRSLSVVSQMSMQKNSGCMLPFWCVYIAYAICVILCLLSVILVLLYGYNFGADVAIKWVLSLCLTVFISILIVEPLKVLVLAAYVTVRAGGIGEENSDMIDIKPQVESNEQFKDVKFRPLGGFALLQAREEEKKKQRLHIMMREVLMFTFMFGIFLAIVYINYSSNSMYQTTSNIHRKLYSGLNRSYGSSLNLNITNLRSIPDFWQWTQTVLARSLHYRQLFQTESFGYLMGPAWLRQIRGEIVTCPAALKTALLSVPEIVRRRCVDSGTSDPDTLSYATGWASGSTNWTYTSSSQLNRFDTFGQSLMYHGGGYIQRLGLTFNDTVTRLQQLKTDGWVDLLTRAVFIEFTLYSPSMDLTSCVTLVLEFPTTGGILASSTVWTEHLLRFIPGHVDPIMVCQVMFLPFILYLTGMVYSALRSQKLLFFTHLWNWLDLFTCILVWANSGLYVVCVVMATNEVKAYLTDLTSPAQLEKVALLHCVLRDVHACIMVLFILKIVRQVRFIRPLYKFYKTLATASAPLLGIFFMFIILLLTYAQFGYLIYGSAVYGYHSFQHSLMSLFGIMGSHTNFQSMLEFSRVYTHLFFISFGTFVYGLFIALSVAVLTWSFKWSRTQMKYKTSVEPKDYEMIEFMIKRFKLLTGMRKQKPLFRHVKFQGLPSLPSRSTSANISQRSIISPIPNCSESEPKDTVQEYLEHCMANLQPAWDQVVKTVEKIENLDKRDEEKLQDILSQIMKPSPADNKLELPNSKPVIDKPPLGLISDFPRLQSYDGEKDITVLPGQISMTPPSATTCDIPLATFERRPVSSQKVRCDPKLNNEDEQPKKRFYNLDSRVRPAEYIDISAILKESMFYRSSAASLSRMGISKSTDNSVDSKSGCEGSSNKEEKSGNQDTEV